MDAGACRNLSFFCLPELSHGYVLNRGLMHCHPLEMGRKI
jgi:hypothetical protein